MSWWKSLKGRIRFNEPLKNKTTFRIGGRTLFFIEPRDLEDLRLLLILLRKQKIKILVIGAGSNVLVPDKDLNGAVLRLSSRYFQRVFVKDSYLVLRAGVSLSRGVKLAMENRLSGIEFLYGIPGTIGGALFMNAGAWGDHIRNWIETVTVMDYSGEIRVLPKKKIRFAYRRSGLSKYIILEAKFKLKADKKSAIEERMKDYLIRRSETQDLSFPSCGCIFKNPKDESAGRLIDLCGLKGAEIGGARVSNKHANFILNTNNSTEEDVLRLISLIKRKVRDRFRINLEPEIKIWR